MWYAATTNFENEGLELHGEFDTREDALESAMDAAGESEVAFALEGSFELPTDDYHGLPTGMTAQQFPLAQVAAIQKWLRGGDLDEVQVYSFGVRLVLRYQKSEDPAWAASVVTIHENGAIDNGWHLGVVTAQSKQVVGGELVC